jgi:hypothetical protein
MNAGAELVKHQILFVNAKNYDINLLSSTLNISSCFVSLYTFIRLSSAGHVLLFPRLKPAALRQT